MSAAITVHEFDFEQHTLEIAPNSVVPSKTLSSGAKVVMLICGLLLLGSIAITAIVLGWEMLVAGGFFAFTMMMMIGMPLILASVSDALDHAESAA